MKNNNWKLLVNPFTRIAGWNAFLFGAIIVCITVVLGHLNDIYYPNVLDMKIFTDRTLGFAFIVQCTGLASLVIIMYLASLIYARNVRFQDILGTTTLARFPYLFLSLIGFFIKIENTDNLIPSLLDNTFRASDYTGLLVITLISVLFIIWYIALLYNAFSVSTNIKGAKGIIIFIGVIIIAEIFSIILSYFIIKNLVL